MSVNLDRFSQGYTPKVPDEVGSCEACGGVIYDYEFAKCQACDAQIHTGCIKKCDICGRKGCTICLHEYPEDGWLYCEECNPEPKRERPVTFVEVVRVATEKLS